MNDHVDRDHHVDVASGGKPPDVCSKLSAGDDSREAMMIRAHQLVA